MALGQFPVCQRRAEGTRWGEGGIFRYTIKVLQHFKEEKEEIFSLAQAQSSFKLFFLLGWGWGG